MTPVERVLLAAAPILLAGSAAPQSAPPAGKLWPFEAIPYDYLERTHGFAPEESWLEHARLGALKIDGVGTASFVSERGLILTNQHCIRAFLERMATEDADFNRDGFLAPSPAEEPTLPGLSVRQLVGIEDVTDAMLGGIHPETPEDEVARRLAENRAAIEAEARGVLPELDAVVVSTFSGARHHLYLYDVWSDVRLAFTPHLALAYFGGSTDNFSYPHYATDFALLRAYRDGRPADTTGLHFDLSTKPVHEGDSVFAVGNPGSLERHVTLGRSRWHAEGKAYCAALDLRDQVELLGEYLDAHPERREALEGFEFSLVTMSKYMRAARDAFADERRREVERRTERDLAARVAADPELAARIGDPWSEAERIVEEAGDLARRLWFHRPAVSDARWFEPLRSAMRVVEAVHPETSEARREAALRDLEGLPRGDPLMIAPFFTAHLERARQVLGADDPAVATMLAGREPEEAVRRLLEESRITSIGYVDDLLAGGWAAVSTCDDLAIVAARVLAPLNAANEEQAAAVESALARLDRLAGLAIAALSGPEVSPEPSFSLRLGDGVVAGYEQLGTRLPASTQFLGLYARALEFEGDRDFLLPDLWRERRATLDLSTPLNFVCTIDIVGGSSGSAVLNREGDLVGLLFDGNVQMVENGFVYLDDQARAIAVHAAAIVETLRDVYDAHALVEELLGAGR